VALQRTYGTGIEDDDPEPSIRRHTNSWKRQRSLGIGILPSQRNRFHVRTRRLQAIPSAGQEPLGSDQSRPQILSGSNTQITRGAANSLF